MTDVTLREVDLVGHDCHTAVTDLLIDARSDDPLAGLWEAGDLQWWWTIDNGLADRRDTFWLGSEEKPVACLLTSVLGSASYCEAIWRPIADDQVRKEVFPTLLSRLVELDQGPDHRVWITVDERDIDFRKRLDSTMLLTMTWCRCGNSGRLCPIQFRFRPTCTSMTTDLARRIKCTTWQREMASVSQGDCVLARCTGQIWIFVSEHMRVT